MHDYLDLEVERVEVGRLVEEREILQIGVPSHCAFVSHVRDIRAIKLVRLTMIGNSIYPLVQ